MARNKGYKLTSTSQALPPQSAPEVNPGLNQGEQRALLQSLLQVTRDRHFKLQCVKLKNKDQMLMLQALEIEIGYILLEIEELG